MRYVIISDIHSNYESLSTFAYTILPGLKADKIVCLGDIVGYNADPDSCMNTILRELSALTIRGNHDRAVGFDDFSYFSEKAHAAGKWTRKHLDHSKLDLLKALPAGPADVDGEFTISHGSATDEDKYILTKQHTEAEFSWLKNNSSRILFYGHTHLQKIFKMKVKTKEISVVGEKNIKVEKGSLYIVNPGSIGQPRDRNPKAGFAIFDTDEMIIKVTRYEYDFKTTQRKILDSRMPYAEELAARLSFGI